MFFSARTGAWGGSGRPPGGGGPAPKSAPRSLPSAHGTILKIIKKPFKNVDLAPIEVTERGAGGVLGTLRVVLGGLWGGAEPRTARERLNMLFVAIIV